MSNSYIVSNILEPIFSHINNTPPSVLYDFNNSLFDAVFCANPNLHVYTQLSQVNSYCAYWTNNPVSYTSDIDLIRKLHIQDMIYFRDLPSANIKKEDKFLIQNRIESSCKLYQNTSVKNGWTINSGYELRYGVPIFLTNHSPDSRDSSVVVINTQNLKSINLLYQHIKQYWPDAQIINNLPSSNIYDVANILQKYKVCIAPEDNYNILMGLSSGCITLSNKHIDHCEYVLFIDLPSLLENINTSINNYAKYDPLNNIDIISRFYSIDIFYDSILTYIKTHILNPIPL